jgi:hypothetical protein
MRHELKTWPEHYDNVVKGAKTFEIRKNDRDFRVGDTVALRRFCPEKKEYTGEECVIYISHLLDGKNTQFGLSPDYCILSIKLMFIDGKIANVQ